MNYEQRLEREMERLRPLCNGIAIAHGLPSDAVNDEKLKLATRIVGLREALETLITRLKSIEPKICVLSQPGVKMVIAQAIQSAKEELARWEK